MRVRLPGVWGKAVLACGWALAAAMIGVAGVRVAGADSRPWLIGVAGVGVWLLLPAYPLAVLAFCRRHAALGVVAAVICLGQIGWSVEVVGWHGDRAAPAGSTQVRLVTANVLLDNPEIFALAGELASSGAEVILLQEITPENLATLQRTPLWAAYPHRVLDPLPGFHGSAILSRYPIVNGGPIDVAGYPMTQADLATPAGVVRVVDVHAVAPLTTANASRWVAQLAQLSRMDMPADRPLVLAGDFNATLDHGPLRELVVNGFRDAFVESGRGLGATWPRWRGLVPPVMRLDHVFVSQQFTVMSIREQTSAGSDHRRLVVQLALPTS